MFYKGSSMNPTFQFPDELDVKPYENGERARPGDVVVFVPPGKDEKVVHRVVSISEKGIRTRGDNSRGGYDRWIIKPADVIGRVVYVKRGKRRRRIFGGLMGQFFIIPIRMKGIFISFLSLTFRPFYHALERAGIFKGWVKTKVFVFNRTIGKEFYILLGSRLIGRFRSGRGYIKRPFRIFVSRDFK